MSGTLETEDKEMSAMNEKPDAAALLNASAIIERFGGIRPMAAKMGVPVTTVQGWKKRDVIPGNRRDDVTRAAAENDVDIADLLSDSAANQNAGFGTGASASTRSDDFDTAMQQARRAVPAPQDARYQDARHDDAVAAGRVTAMQDDLLRSIRAAEKRAVKTSSWFSGILVVGVCALGAVLLWPTHQQVQETGRRVQVLEGQMTQVQADQTAVRGLIPPDFGDKLARWQDQAVAIQDRVAAAALQAENLAATIVGQGAGTIGNRLATLEGQVAGIASASPDMAGLIARVKELQQSVEGQQQLAQSVTNLKSIVDGLNGHGPEQLDEALAGAQQADGPLGRTLEGVPQTDLRAAAMLVGLAQFRSSLNRNAPFEDDLQLMKKLVGPDDAELTAALDRLAPRAAEGVLTPAGLSGQFKALAGDIVVSSLKGEDVSVQEKARARLNEIMQVQKGGELITGTDTQATVARAQKMLDDGDIQGALATLKTLEGPAAETAQPFMDEAMATMTAEKVKEMLTGRVLDRLGQSVGGASSAPIARGTVDGILEDIEGVNRRVVTSPHNNIMILPPGPKLPSQH